MWVIGSGTARGQPCGRALSFRCCSALAPACREPDSWALALSGRATIHLADDEPEAARRLWEQALAMFTRTGVPERQDVERRLAALDSGTDQLRTPVGGGRMES